MHDEAMVHVLPKNQWRGLAPTRHTSRTDSQLEDLSVVTQRIWGFLWIEGVVTMAVLVEEVLVTRHAPADGARIGAHRSCGTWTWWGHERRNQESIAHILVCLGTNLGAERVVNGRRNVCLRRNIILSSEGLGDTAWDRSNTNVSSRREQRRGELL